MRWAVGAVILVGVILPRVFLISGYYPVLIDADEAVTGLMSLHILEGKFPVFFYGQHYMGALESYWHSIFLYVGGAGPLMLKVGSLALFLIFLVAHFLLARQILRDYWASIMATALVGISTPFLMVWSTKARGGYLAFLLFGTLSLLLACRFFESKGTNRTTPFLLGLSLGLGFWSHFGTVTIGAGILVTALITFRNHLRGLLIWTGLGFLVGATPVWIYNLIHLGASLGRPMLRQTTLLEDLSNIFLTGFPIIVGGRLPRGEVGILPFVGIFLTAALVIAYIVSARNLRREGRGIWWLMASFPVILLASVVISGAGHFMVQPRYLLILYSVLYIALISAFRKNSYRLAISALLLGLNLYGTSQVSLAQFIDEPNIEDNRSLVSFLSQNRIQHSIAPYWIAYRLTFETAEAHISTPPADEYVRDQDYFQQVNADPRHVYIQISGVGPPEMKLKEIPGEGYEKVRVGNFEVFLRSDAPQSLENETSQ